MGFIANLFFTAMAVFTIFILGEARAFAVDECSAPGSYVAPTPESLPELTNPMLQKQKTIPVLKEDYERNNFCQKGDEACPVNPIQFGDNSLLDEVLAFKNGTRPGSEFPPTVTPAPEEATEDKPVATGASVAKKGYYRHLETLFVFVPGEKNVTFIGSDQSKNTFQQGNFNQNAGLYSYITKLVLLKEKERQDELIQLLSTVKNEFTSVGDSTSASRVQEYIDLAIGQGQFLAHIACELGKVGHDNMEIQKTLSTISPLLLLYRP